jgi:aquaporin NIP
MLLKQTLMKKYTAEFIGTFALVFCGTGAIIINQETHGVITHLGIAASFGLAIMTMIFALGNVSGAHFNPAVSIGFTIARKMPIKDTLLYIVSQLAGAFVASFVLKSLFPANEMLGTTLPAGSDMQSFILEIVLTFFLMFVILNVTQGTKEQGMFAGIAIGGTILLDAVFGGPISGASMNPARSIAPAVITGHLQSLWVYIVAPIIGAVVAVVLYSIVKPSDK